MVYTSGQIAIDPAVGDIVAKDIAGQAEQVMKNLCEVLRAAGSSPELVVKTTCFLANIGDFAAFNEIYGKYFTEKPARSCVAAAALPKGALVEVEAVALLA
jgi:2-iminobutanoate/2-iminopropanoate deaminase